jgi:ParB family transcriptional regulator, chromosome partitioning protein
MAQNYGLGRGLSSLIPSKKQKIIQPEENVNYFGNNPVSSEKTVPGNTPPSQANEEKSSVMEVDIEKIVPNPFQPRTDFSEEKLFELAQSIKEHGIIQPIVLSKKKDGYEIIAGERRLQAAKIAGMRTVPAILREEKGNQDKLELAIVENVQRENLSPIEEAKSYLKLTQEFNLTQEEVAKKMGKSRSVVANKTRLLNLPVEIQKALIAGKITEGHCKLLLAIPNAEKQRAFFDLILKNGLTVRQTEEKTKEVSVKTHKRNVKVDPQTKSLEDSLGQILGTKVKFSTSGNGGKIVIEYYSKEELNSILEKIK